MSKHYEVYPMLDWNSLEFLTQSFVCDECGETLPVVTSTIVTHEILIVLHRHTCNGVPMSSWREVKLSCFSEEDRIKLIIQNLPLYVEHQSNA